MAWTCETCKVRGDCMASVLRKQTGESDPLGGFYAGGTFAIPRCEDHSPRVILHHPRPEHPLRVTIMDFIRIAPHAVSTREICIAAGRTPSKVDQSRISWHLKILVARGALHVRRDRDTTRSYYYWHSAIPDDHLPELARIHSQLQQVVILTRAGLDCRSIGNAVGLSEHTVSDYRSEARRRGLLPPMESHHEPTD